MHTGPKDYLNADQYDATYPSPEVATKVPTIDIIFDGPPSHQSGRFVEVERDGRSVRIGEWVKLDTDYWALRIPDPHALDGDRDGYRAQVSDLKMLLREVYHALREPDNGVHYCRGCDASTDNAWKHSPACPLEIRGAEVIRLRSKIRAVIGDPTETST